MTEQPVEAGSSATPEARPFFSRLPLWGKVVFILILPVSLGYAIYRMWKTRAFTQNARVILTALGVLFTLVVAFSGGQDPESTATATLPATPTTAVRPATPTTAERPATQVPGTTPEVVEPETAPQIDVTAVTVTRIIDGDTVEVRMPEGTTEKVRFIGVDTPEISSGIQAYGPEATAYTSTP